MCPARQFVMTHVVIFVLCACNAVDRLVCALRAFFYPPGDTPHKARMTFVLLLAAKKSCSRFFILAWRRQALKIKMQER